MQTALLAELARDPTALVGQAVDAELAALLYERLERCGALGRVPASDVARLQQEHRRTLAQNVVFLAELGAVVGAFALAGIRIILLKGAALLKLGVFAAATRPMSDLDLLVDAADFARAAAVLDQLGYRPETVHSVAYEDRYAGQRAFLRAGPAGRCWVDLHRELFAVDWLRGEDAAYRNACWRRSRDLPGPTPARVLDPADQAVHTLLHWALHHGLGGVWPAVDAAAIARLDGFTWEGFVERARESSWPIATFLALQRATALTGCAAPAGVVASLGPGPYRHALLGRLFATTAAVLPPAASVQATRLLHLAAAEPRLALRLLGRAIWPEQEWLALRYGQPAGPATGLAARAGRRLHYLARLARLTIRGLQQVIASRREAPSKSSTPQ